MKNYMLIFMFSLTLNAQDWKEYTIEDGAFSIEFPSTPKEQSQIVPVENTNLELKLLIYEENNKALMVGFTDYTDNQLINVTVDTFFINARNGIIKNTSGNLESEKIISYDGFPGREIIISLPNNGKIRTHYFLVRNRLFQVMFAGEQENMNDPDVIKFFDSFKVEENAGLSKIGKMLTDLGYAFDIAENKEYQVTMQFDDMRTQLVRISSIISSLTSTEKYDIWSVISQYSGKIDPAISHEMFQESSETEIGSFQSFKNDEGHLLVYSAVFHGDLNQQILQTVINDVAAMADTFEEKITKKDDY